MCIVSVDIPEAVRQNTRMDMAATSDFACHMVAVAYFLRLHQPLADCAKIARMSIPDFQELLKSSGIGADAIQLLSDLHEGYRSGEEREGGIRPIRFAHTAFKRERRWKEYEVALVRSSSV